jgi:hypothetical protein
MAADPSRLYNFFGGTLAIAALTMAAPAFAQTSSSQPAVEATPPAASALSEAAAKRAKALGAYSEALAVGAASWGSPLVTMYCLRHNDAVGPHLKAAVNAIWRMGDISTPALSQEADYVTPNVNTLYGFGFLDLAAEPVILSMPDSHGRPAHVTRIESPTRWVLV